MKVKIYTKPTCPYCQQAKKWLKDNNIEFDDFNVEEEKYKDELVEVSGQMGVPVIVAGEKIIVGFEEKELEQLKKRLMRENKMVEVTCKCGNKQDVEIKKGLCIPFVKCNKCGELIDTKHLCH